MSTYIIKTLGCKVNQYETEAISQSLQDAGFTVATSEDADICIINTCTVTRKASMQSRQAIRQAIRSHPNAHIIVTGCYAQTEPDRIRQIKGVHDVVSNTFKYAIAERITQKREPRSMAPVRSGILEKHQNDFLLSHAPVFGHRTRTFLKIQDGCDAFCSYCIVPYARGASRSMPFDSVLENIRHLEEYGSLEIVLSGIHLGAYGLDLTPRKTLFELLTHLNEFCSAVRFRLSSIEPRELSNEIIQLASSSHTICNHFHIPMQSGNNGILTQMNRPYTRSYFSNLIKTIYTTVPDVSIGVDIIIGFPGETDDAFNDTYQLIRDLPVSYLHVFPFSPRQGTRAAALSEKVPSSIIKMRSQQMRQLGTQKKMDFYKKFIGKIVDVLVESSRDKQTGCLKGLTSNYIKVLINGPDSLKNTIVRAKIEKIAETMALEGSIMSEM